MIQQSQPWANIQTIIQKDTGNPIVHSSTIHSSQDMEATYMSTDRRMDNKDMVHIYNGILLNHIKEQDMSFAATWMQLEIIILKEVSQKDKYEKL